MKTNLTERYIKSLTPEEKPYEVIDAGMSGFLLRVQPTGGMTFYVSYRNKSGERQRVKLGAYGHITLTQARDLAKQHLGAIASGIDPNHEKKQVKVEAVKAKEEAITLKKFVEEVYQPWVMANRKSGAHTMLVLDRYFHQWFNKPMMDFTRQQIEEWQIKQHKRGLKPSAVNRPLNALKSVFTRAHELNLIQDNILRPVKKMQECKDIRVRYLAPDEVDRLKSVLQERNQEQINKRVMVK